MLSMLIACIISFVRGRGAYHAHFKMGKLRCSWSRSHTELDRTGLACWQQGTQPGRPCHHPIHASHLPLHKLVPVVAGERPVKRDRHEMSGQEGIGATSQSNVVWNPNVFLTRDPTLSLWRPRPEVCLRPAITPTGIFWWSPREAGRCLRSLDVQRPSLALRWGGLLVLIQLRGEWCAFSHSFM